MAITIRNQRLEEGIRKLGRLRKEGPSAVIARLVNRELRELDLDIDTHESHARRYAALREWVDGLPPLTDADRRAIDQAMEDMYDENGLPR